MTHVLKGRPSSKVVFLLSIFFGIFGVTHADAGKKPLNNPPEVTDWFKNSAVMTSEAEERLKPFIQEAPERPLTEEDKQWMNEAETTREFRLATGMRQYLSCCKYGDRVKAEFSVDKSNGEDVWSYTDPKSGQKIVIPSYTIHNENDPKMPEALRQEGVLFIYSGRITCFWPPRPNY